MYQSGAKQKLQKIKKEMASEHKKRYFEQARNRLLSAQHDQRQEEEHQAEMQLLSMFNSKQELAHVLQLYEEYERDQEAYQSYMLEMEEESINYERLEIERNLQKKRQLFWEIFADDE